MTRHIINASQLAADICIDTILAYHPVVYVYIADQGHEYRIARYSTKDCDSVKNACIVIQDISCEACFSCVVRHPSTGALVETWYVPVNKCKSVAHINKRPAEIDTKHNTDDDCPYSTAITEVELGCHACGIHVCQCHSKHHTCEAPQGYYRITAQQYLHRVNTHRMVCPEEPRCENFYDCTVCLKRLTSKIPTQ